MKTFDISLGFEYR